MYIVVKKTLPASKRIDTNNKACRSSIVTVVTGLKRSEESMNILPVIFAICVTISLFSRQWF